MWFCLPLFPYYTHKHTHTHMCTCTRKVPFYFVTQSEIPTVSSLSESQTFFKNAKTSGQDFHHVCYGILEPKVRCESVLCRLKFKGMFPPHSFRNSDRQHIRNCGVSNEEICLTCKSFVYKLLSWGNTAVGRFLFNQSLTYQYGLISTCRC